MTDVIVKREDGSLDVGLRCDDPSLTVQSEAAACDINKIMARYEKSGLISHLNQNAAFYADVSAVPDYQAALDVVEKADALFMSLPAEIRAEFDNDPGRYLDFVSDPANKARMIELGIIEKPLPEKPSLAEEVASAIKASGLVNKPVVA